MFACQMRVQFLVCVKINHDIVSTTTGGMSSPLPAFILHDMSFIGCHYGNVETESLK